MKALKRSQRSKEVLSEAINKDIKILHYCRMNQWMDQKLLTPSFVQSLHGHVSWNTVEIRLVQTLCRCPNIHSHLSDQTKAISVYWKLLALFGNIVYSFYPRNILYILNEDLFRPNLYYLETDNFSTKTMNFLIRPRKNMKLSLCKYWQNLEGSKNGKHVKQSPNILWMDHIFEGRFQRFFSARLRIVIAEYLSIYCLCWDGDFFSLFPV